MIGNYIWHIIYLSTGHDIIQEKNIQ